MIGDWWGVVFAICYSVWRRCYGTLLLAIGYRLLAIPLGQAPERSTLGKLDKSEWPAGKFNGGEPEDPWTPTIELPMQHRETGDEYIYVAQTRGSLAAVKDLLAQCRRLPEGHNPIVRLAVGSYKGKFGTVKKPVLTIVGKSPIDGGADEGPFDDEIPF